MSQTDRASADRARTMDTSLLKESNYIIGCLRDDRPTNIQTDSFTLAGLPSIGGTAVWGAHIGHPVTCTIVPTMGGHRVHITYRKTLLNGIQRAAAGLISHRVPEIRKRRILSEIALEHYETIFILSHRWNALTADQQKSVKSIVKKVDTQHSEKLGRLRRKPWVLRGNPEVPDFFS